MAEIITGKDSNGVKHPILTDSNGAIVVSGSTAANVAELDNAVAVLNGYAASIASNTSGASNRLSTWNNSSVETYLYLNNSQVDNQALGYNAQSGGFHYALSHTGNSATQVYASTGITDGSGEPAPILGGFSLYNTSSGVRYFKIYDGDYYAAFNNISPIFCFAVGPAQSLTIQPPIPWSFENGISYNFSSSATTNTSVGTGDLVLNLWYSQHSNY